MNGRMHREELRSAVESAGALVSQPRPPRHQTAPDHFLGDYPSQKWRRFSAALPQDLTGKAVLDIGCNGGFYAIEMKRRGCRPRAGRRLGRKLPDTGALRGEGAGPRHRIPQALGL